MIGSHARRRDFPLSGILYAEKEIPRHPHSGTLRHVGRQKTKMRRQDDLSKRRSSTRTRTGESYTTLTSSLVDAHRSAAHSSSQQGRRDTELTSQVYTPSHGYSMASYQQGAGLSQLRGRRQASAAGTHSSGGGRRSSGAGSGSGRQGSEGGRQNSVKRKGGKQTSSGTYRALSAGKQTTAEGLPFSQQDDTERQKSRRRFGKRLGKLTKRASRKLKLEKKKAAPHTWTRWLNRHFLDVNSPTLPWHARPETWIQVCFRSTSTNIFANENDGCVTPAANACPSGRELSSSCAMGTVGCAPERNKQKSVLLENFDRLKAREAKAWKRELDACMVLFQSMLLLGRVDDLEKIISFIETHELYFSYPRKFSLYNRSVCMPKSVCMPEQVCMLYLCV